MPEQVPDWNAVVTLRRRGHVRGLKLLRRFCETRPTGFHNVLALRASDPIDLLAHTRLMKGHRYEAR